MRRTHGAGELRSEHEGRQVTLAGWVARRRDHGGVVFIDLRDATGTVQVVFRAESVAEAAHALRSEWCVEVTGVVTRRPEGNENPGLPTGAVEVPAEALVVLSEAEPLPFGVAETGAGDVGEEIRLRHRYLDLRRAPMAHALRTRSAVTHVIRRVMEEHGFLDVETPYLTRSTPEGARDFLVPVRLQPGTWYALPQSPQLFKQLLMVSGIERYYQIARCFRDEDFRADRQPEFTQLDVEMSFAEESDIMALAEDVVVAVWRDVLGVHLPQPFPRMSYAEAMDRYGSDKPDLRFGLELVELSEFFSGTEVGVLAGALARPGGYVGAVLVPGGAAMTRRQLDGWQDWARGRGAKGLAWVAVEADGGLRSPLVKFFSDAERDGLAAVVGASPGDLLFLAAAPRAEAQELLGALRLAVARQQGLIPDPGAEAEVAASEREWRFLWVVEPPMFDDDGQGGWTSMHHPFTAPAPGWEERLTEEPGAAPSRAYDMVLNGTEIGGGSVRIHDRAVQRRVLDVIGLSPEEAEGKFGFLLEAFRYGPPPHGGIAFGLDRMVALAVGAESIRDVIAFPKTASGADPLTGAPTPITAAQRVEAGIDAKAAAVRGEAPVPNEPGHEVMPDVRRN